MELDSNCHSVFLIYYHLVLVVKYRRNVFDDIISEFSKDIFVRIGVLYHDAYYNECRKNKTETTKTTYTSKGITYEVSFHKKKKRGYK